MDLFTALTLGLVLSFSYIILIAGLSLFFNLRALAGRHPDAQWARLLFHPIGPRTDVRYMTRRELFWSGLWSILIAAGMAALLVGLGYAITRKPARNTDLLSAWWVISAVCIGLAAVFSLSGLILVIRGLFRSSSFTPPRPVAADVEHAPYLMIDQSWYRKPDGSAEHVSCGGVVARIENNKIMIALLREDGFKNHVLPKGHVEKGESLESAARREIAEESGLTDLRLIRELGVRERMDLKKTAWKTTHYFLFATGQSLGHPTDAHHTYVLEWFPLDALPRMFWPEQQELVETNRDRIKQLVKP